MSEQLTVKPYSYQTDREAFDVVDANGLPISKGVYVQVLDKHHAFLREGEIVRVEGAQSTDRNGIASLQIRTARNSSTGIDSNEVKIADDEQLDADFQLAFVAIQVAGNEQAIAALYEKRVQLQYQLRLAKARVAAMSEGEKE